MSDRLDYGRLETWTDEDIDAAVKAEQGAAARGEGPVRPEDHFPVEYEYDGPGKQDVAFGDLATFGPVAAAKLGWGVGRDRDLTAEDVERTVVYHLKEARSALAVSIRRIEKPDYTTRHEGRAFNFSKRETQLERLGVGEAIAELQVVQDLVNCALELAKARRESDKEKSRRLEAERRQTPEWAAHRRDQLRSARESTRRMLADPNVVIRR